jgi:hypothetical protein
LEIERGSTAFELIINGVYVLYGGKMEHTM